MRKGTIGYHMVTWIYGMVIASRTHTQGSLKCCILHDSLHFARHSRIAAGMMPVVQVLVAQRVSLCSLDAGMMLALSPKRTNAF